MANAKRDGNSTPTLLGVSNADGTTPVIVYADPTTHRLLVDLASAGGTVTSVSVASANGFAGTVATATTTPAITISTTITGVLSGNGTAISAASTVGSGSVVLATTPTLTTPVLGVATATSITTSGANQLGVGSTINMLTPTSAGATGPTTNSFNSGYSSTAVGDLVYLDSSATWQKADATTSAATKAGLLGIALTVTASGAAATVALPGSLVFATAWNLATVGAPIYMSTAGAITLTQPSATDNAIRVIGWVTASGNSTTKIFFQPSPDYITHT